jgi:hypothetical protein
MGVVGNRRCIGHDESILQARPRRITALFEENLPSDGLRQRCHRTGSLLLTKRSNALLRLQTYCCQRLHEKRKPGKRGTRTTEPR